jgi:NADH dehydrogenase
VDAGGTRNLAAAAAAAGCRRIVYLSAAGAGGSAPWLRAKAVAEQAVAASGLAYTVLRPAWVYGPGDRTLTRLLRAMRRLPAVPIVGSGRRRVQPVSVLDVAAVAVRAAFDEGATARVLALAGPETLAIDAVARIVQCALGARRPLVHVPVGLARALAGLAFALPGRRSAPGAIDFEVSENLVDPEPAARLFGIELERFEPVLRRLVAAGRL